MVIAIVGLGLIGASLAKAIKAKTKFSVVGIDKNSEVEKKALKENAIDAAGDRSSLKNADLTIISLYPSAAENFVKSNAAFFKKGSVVIDTCGVKKNICSRLVKFSHDNGFEFIGAHPMAGKEKFGYDYSDAALFNGAYMILTPVDANENNVAMLSDLSRQIGFKDVTVASPEEHDKIIAYTSQLPHALACAYINDPGAVLHSGFSAGSYKDISRVADINAVLWRELFSENKEPLIECIDALTENLRKIKKMLESGNMSELSAFLETARRRKSEIG